MIQTKQPIDWAKYFFMLLALLFAILWLRSCETERQTPQIADVTVPEVEGKLEYKKPDHELVKLPTNDKSKIVKVENPANKELEVENKRLNQYVAENEKLKLAFAQETDSLKKQLLFEKVVQLNNFSTDFDDDNLELHIEGVVQGEVKEITPSYKIKERTAQAEVKAKETVLRLLGGAELGLPTNTNIPLPIKANLMLQNRKGNIWSGSIDTNGTIWAGYNFSIANFKR